MDSMYLDNLDEFINDEKRIVTYRWLSLTLNVSSNIAKQMLYHYYDVNHKKQSPDEDQRLSVTYLLSGVTFDEDLKQDIHKICVVHDAELERVKKSFRQIYSLHIYSIQKVELKDLHILYGIDYDKIRENVFQSAEYSAIVFPTSKIKSDASSRQLVHNDLPDEKPSPRKLNIEKEETDVVDQNKENRKNEKNTQSGPKKEAKGSLASMFANQTKKQEGKKPLEIKQEPNSKSKDVSRAAVKKGSLYSFLSKDTSVKKERKSESSITAEKLPEASPVKVKDDKPTITVDSDSDSGVEEIKTEVRSESKISPKKATGAKRKPTNNSQNSRRKTNAASKGKRKSSSNSNTNSKRQRIITLDDSSSESSSEEEEQLMEECPVPSPPRLIESDDEEDVIPLTPNEKDSSEGQNKDGKRRKRKLVDKTYEDEHGFLVTKKEYEYVTDSDGDENPIPPPKVVETSPKKSPKKTSPPIKSTRKSPVKSKQSSIMSFFKRN